MLDAVVGAVIMVVATTTLLYSVEVAERAFAQAGRSPLNSDERDVLRGVGLGSSEAELFWRQNIQNLPREVRSDE